MEKGDLRQKFPSHVIITQDFTSGQRLSLLRFYEDRRLRYLGCGGNATSYGVRELNEKRQGAQPRAVQLLLSVPEFQKMDIQLVTEKNASAYRLGSTRLEEAGSCRRCTVRSQVCCFRRICRFLKHADPRNVVPSQFETPAAATQCLALPTTSNGVTIPVHLTLDLISRIMK